jgi:hypothetical protein
MEAQHRDQDLLIGALAKAVNKFCHFQQCDSVSLTSAYPKRLTQTLRKALA